MDDRIKKQRMIEYLTSALEPAEVKDLQFVKEIEDVETKIWLAEMDTGEEYWVLEGSQPANMYKKCGLYQDLDIVLEVYWQQMHQLTDSQTLDRMQMYTEEGKCTL